MQRQTILRSLSFCYLLLEKQYFIGKDTKYYNSKNIIRWIKRNICKKINVFSISFQFVPVEPNPPSPLVVSSKLLTS